MKLRRLELHNFRQFYGTQTIVFDDTPSKNVCVVYAANGAGKTTLLNALTWVLYKKLGDDFEQADRLVNHRAWDGCNESDTVQASVRLEFEHGGRTWTVTRVHEVRKHDNEPLVLRDGDVSLLYIDEDGESGGHENPTNAIDQILPARLHTFFFFNGERIEHLVRPTAYEEIEAAIKTLLGLEVVERGHRHLDTAVRTLQKDLHRLGSGEAQGIIDEMDRLVQETDSKQSQISDLRERRNALTEERDAVLGRLRMMEDTRKLQERRDGLDRRIKDLEEYETNTRKRMDSLLANTGFLAFLDDLTDQTVEQIEQNRVRGELPAPIKRQFVQDLLDTGECICGTKLQPGESPHDHVADWVRRSGLADVEDAVTRLSAHAEDFIEQRAALFNEIGQLSATLSEQRSKRQGLAEQLDEVSTALKESPLEEAAMLEQRRESVDAELDQLRRRFAVAQAELELLGTQKKAKQKELDRVKEVNEKAALAHRRVSVATETRDLLIQLHEMRTQDVRLELDNLIKDVYRGISFKDYQPELNEEFRLELHDPNRNNAEIARSTGENQILSLSFVGALAALARQRTANGNSDSQLGALLGFEGGIYPVVMDAAFGALDENYRRSVAQALPTLTDQVIVLVSKSQGLGAVQEELQPRIAGEFIIHYRTPKEDAEDETISLRGHEYSYITRSEDNSEWASIEQIT